MMVQNGLGMTNADKTEKERSVFKAICRKCEAIGCTLYVDDKKFSIFDQGLEFLNLIIRNSNNKKSTSKISLLKPINQIPDPVSEFLNNQFLNKNARCI